MMSAHDGNQQNEEEDIMERELAEDAVWKRIQKNTFTRWANEHLRTVNKHIENLESDLIDGLRVIALVEVLSGRRLPKHNRRPTMRAHKLENVNIALKFLTVDEGIKIVNIDSTDIVDGHLKLILGLIWTLILHYSISMPVWEGEDDSMYGQKGGPTPKQRLLGWIKNKIPEVPVHNFNKDWNDGKALGALVDAVAPGLCPDWVDWKPEDALQNANEAMKLATDWLDIPQLVKPEDVVNPGLDELSMMTYLSQYPNAKLKEGAPLRPRNNPNRVRCYGPGIQPTGVVVGAPTHFTVETFSAGKGKVEVFLENPKGKNEPVEIKFNDDRSKTYTCTYTAKMEGSHKVIVKFSGSEVPKSPFSVSVEGVAGDCSKVIAKGPGLEPSGNQVGKPTYFDISTKGAGLGQVEVVIMDPKGKPNTVPLRLRKISEEEYRCEYVAQATGMHSVNIFFAGKQVPKSPFGVNVAPICDPRKVRAAGRGLQPTGVRVKDIADFKVFTDGAGEGVLDIKVVGPDGKNEKVNIKKLNDTTYDCDYKPMKEGKYIVIVSFGTMEIFRSPFEVTVGPYKESRIRAYGPGLRGGVVGYPACFTVDTNGEPGTLGFTVEGPSQARIECDDNGDGSANVKYHPSAPGEYAIHILSNGDDIPKSPYVAQILPKTDYHPEKVTAKGPGLEPNGVIIGKPTTFTVDTSKAGGHAPVDVSIIDKNFNELQVKTKDNKNGTYTCEYTPKELDKHVVQVNYGGVAIPNSPYRVNVSIPTDAGKVKIFGPGLEDGVKPQVPTHFNIDCEEAGAGKLQVIIKDEKGREIPATVVDNENLTYSVDYTVPAPGNYKVTVLYDGKPVPGCPVNVNATPMVDMNKVKIEGLNSNVYIHSPNEFTVDAKALKRTDAQVTCSITNPSGSKLATTVKNMNDGTSKVSYTPFEEGVHKVEIFYDGQLVPGSPFKVNATKGCNPNKVKAYGPGLERGITNQKNQFTIETKNAGFGAIGLSIEGPQEAKMTCKDNRDGTCTVEYFPTEPGYYDIGVKFANQSIPGSPFKVLVDVPVDPSKVKANGPGVDPTKCRAGPPLPFTVDAKKSGKAPLNVEVISDSGPIPFKPEIKDNFDGTYDVSYIPPPEGSKCDVNVTYDGKNISGSPFKMKVKPITEPQKVKLSGPGLNKQIPASIPTEFNIDAREAGYGRPEVIINSPNGQRKKAQIIDNNDGTYKVIYTTEEIGQHKIIVKYGGKDVTGSPLTINSVATGQPEKCKVHHPAKEKLAVGEEYCITVDAQNAGKGAVTCHLKNKTQQETTKTRKLVKTTSEEEEEIEEEEITDVRVKDNKDGTYNVYYKVKEPGNYDLDVKFGGQKIPSGTYSFTATTEEVTTTTTTTTTTKQSKSKAKTVAKSTSSTTGKFDQIRLYNIAIPASAKKNQLTSFVKMPSGATEKATIIDNRDGTISIKYDPNEEGLHELHILHNGDHIRGSPFKFHVDSMESGFITAAGPGLTHGVIGEVCPFRIYTKDSGVGGLQVAVEGPSKAEIVCQDNHDGTVDVSYTPLVIGEYKIIVKFGGKDIKGSPFTANITGEGRKRNHISVGHQSEVSLKCSEKDLKNLSASIVSPSEIEEPCFIKKLADGHLGVSFTPREAGEHFIHVKRLANHVAGSPYKIDVLEREIGDAKKVKVIGNAVHEGKTHIDNEFMIDTKEAGFGGLSLSVEGPSKAEIKCNDQKDGTLKISYKPTEPGYYIVNLKFADHHVPGSPFTVKVTGEGSNIQRQNIKKQRDAVPIRNIGSDCSLTFKMPDTSPIDMAARVTSPSGKSEDAEVVDREDFLYAVNFVPTESGIHTVNVKYKEAHIPGSPFQFTVGPLQELGAHRVHAGGPGLERGSTNEGCEFNIWTQEAGPGSLALSVEGPSKAIIDFKDRKDGSCYVSYRVTEPGEYRVGIKFNDQHIPDSPYKVWIMPLVNDAKKIEIRGLPPESQMQINKPITILLNMNDVVGPIDAKVISPSNVEDDCFITEIDREERALRFIPRENGVHEIQVRYNGVHIRESPLKLRIGHEIADPGAVNVSGNGIKSVVCGMKAEFTVDTCNAGFGRLSVTIDGPSKVSLDCVEIEQGYKVSYTPLAPGEYYVTVKYNGSHVVGSPFRVICSGENLKVIDESPETASVAVDTVVKKSKQRPSRVDNTPRFRSDATKVFCKGAGLRRAAIGKENTFSVNCSSAGNNVLFAAVYGPKGPCDQVHVKHIGGNVYDVKYTVKEKGDYVLIVKWGDDHIPGSPYTVVAA